MSEQKSDRADQRPDGQADAVDTGAVAARIGRGAGGAAVGRDRRGDAVAAGDVALRCRQDAGARVRHQERQGGGAGDQFARRIAGAVAPDLFADPAAGGGKETAGAGVRRGCRGIRRLHDRLRRRRDLLRSVLDPGLDRRGRRLLWISGADQERSASSGGFIPPARTRRCSIRSCRKTPTMSRASRRFSARSTPSSSRSSKKAAARASRAPTMCCSPANIGPAIPRSRSDLPMRSAICARPCAPVTATRCRLR